jgi:predicted secreted hydrolase
MGQITFTSGTGVPHRRFEDEFLTHRGVNEWWYCTGFLEAGDHRFAFQFTLARIRVFGVRFHMLLTSLTDLQSGEHYYAQQTAFFGRGVTTSLGRTAFADRASIDYGANEHSPLGEMSLVIRGKEYELELRMQARKPPVWHCEDGRLKMGDLDDPEQITAYFSFTNLAAQGTLTLLGEEYPVTGQAWFDKQGGPYRLTDPKTNWEWFSMRFFDQEEIMLFSFPQTGYRDGTHIRADGSYERLNQYEIEPLDFITEPSTGYRFSDGWKVTTPGVKDGEYVITPVVDGMFNVFFFELLADIRTVSGEVVGRCFVELLPGARNAKLDSALAFRRKTA